MTFSIAARCARTGQLGVAVASSSPAVAARCVHARAGVGAVLTQNVTDPRLGPRGPDLLALGATAVDTVAWPVANLRVDWHHDPIGELGRLRTLWQPQIAGYVTRALDPGAAPPYGVAGERRVP